MSPMHSGSPSALSLLLVLMVNSGHSFFAEGIGTWLHVTSISDFTPYFYLMVFLGWLFEAIIVVEVVVIWKWDFCMFGVVACLYPRNHWKSLYQFLSISWCSRSCGALLLWLSSNIFSFKFSSMSDKVGGWNRETFIMFSFSFWKISESKKA